MTSSHSRKLFVIATLNGLFVAVAMVACGDDGGGAVTNASDSAAPIPADSNTDAPTKEHLDSSVVVDVAVESEAAATQDASTSSLCDAYGGPAAIAQIASNTIDTAKADCRISPNLVITDHASQCWKLFVKSVFQCAGATFMFGKTEDANGAVCENALPGVALSNIDFNAFRDDINATLIKVMTSKDVMAVAPAFEGTRSTLVNQTFPSNKHVQCAPNCVSGGSACQ